MSIPDFSAFGDHSIQRRYLTYCKKTGRPLGASECSSGSDTDIRTLPTWSRSHKSIYCWPMGLQWGERIQIVDEIFSFLEAVGLWKMIYIAC